MTFFGHIDLSRFLSPRQYVQYSFIETAQRLEDERLGVEKQEEPEIYKEHKELEDPKESEKYDEPEKPGDVQGTDGASQPEEFEKPEKSEYPKMPEPSEEIVESNMRSTGSDFSNAKTLRL